MNPQLLELAAELVVIKAMLDSIGERIGLAERERLLTVDEAADVLGVSKRTVYRWVEDGRLNAMRLSRRVLRISARDIGDALREGRVVQTSRLY